MTSVQYQRGQVILQMCQGRQAQAVLPCLWCQFSQLLGRAVGVSDNIYSTHRTMFGKKQP